MTDLLLHPKTAERIAAVLSHPPQGLLITGEAGSGKDTMARSLAAGILELKPEKLASYPYLHVLDPAENVITIEAIRDLQQFLKLKVPTKGSGINRIVIIARAERMRSEAQNALLKTLEEPPAGTCIILTAASSEQLLSTITSRCQELAILPVGKTQAEEYFSQRGIPAAKLAGNYALSMGQAGLLNALLTDSAHPLKEQVELAKSLLGQPASKRLLQVDFLSKDKDGIRGLLNALRRIAHAGLNTAGSRGNVASIKQWHEREAAVLQTREDFERNANAKLLLTNLFLNL